MSRQVFSLGARSVFEGWTTGTFKFALADGGFTPSPDFGMVYVSDIAGFECTAPEYLRQATTSNTVGIGYAGQIEIQYVCDNPTFGVMSGGGTSAWLILYAEVTTDADSPIVVVWPVSYTADGVQSADFTLPGTGPVTVAFACPTSFL